jgi:hypothetical protein
MSRDIAESDWKILREYHPIALDRFCRRILEEIESVVADSSRSRHQRYLAIYQLIERRDREIADAFNDMRRSRAVMLICHLHNFGLLSDEEFARFSDETRGAVQGFLGFAERERAASGPRED